MGLSAAGNRDDLPARTGDGPAVPGPVPGLDGKARVDEERHVGPAAASTMTSSS